jgi:glycosyltransferase involved in cell wall biosynthesis
MNPAVSVDVIGNGVDRELFAEPGRVGRNVVFMGRLELRQKGLDLLMRAWARADLAADIRLVVAGTGPDDAAVRRLAEELGIAHRVDFLGWVRGADKRRLLSEARLLVAPSRQETFGIVALEGLAAGTPVLAFDIHCLREILPAGCGWRVPAFDVQQFADTLTELAGDDALLHAAGVQGRDFASGYDWDLLAARQAEVYRAAAASGAHVA